MDDTPEIPVVPPEPEAPINIFEHAEAQAKFNLLSKREKEVFMAFMEGLPNRDVAKKFFISPRTVETHRARILHKLEMRSLIMVLRWAIREKLIEA